MMTNSLLTPLRLPKMLKPLDLETLRAFYSTVARKLMSDLNPKR